MTRILVVEDEHDLRELLSDYLEALGHEVLRAGTAAEARALLRYSPEVGLVDWSLPDARGDHVVSWIRDTSPTCRLVIMTGHGASVTNRLDSDVQVLHKPFRLADVARLIQRFV
jgi:DNA-binding response OmpR family regulator